MHVGGPLPNFILHVFARLTVFARFCTFRAYRHFQRFLMLLRSFHRILSIEILNYWYKTCCNWTKTEPREAMTR